MVDTVTVYRKGGSTVAGVDAIILVKPVTSAYSTGYEVEQSLGGVKADK